jgi:riboflavin kinase/FMN adenylyltransferase
MQVINDLSQASFQGPSFVTVGSYDGIHIGHQHLVRKMKRAAEQGGHHTVVVSFHPRPREVLLPHLPAQYLTTSSQKVALMVTHLHMRQLWVGTGSALGHNREGNVSTLAKLGQTMGFDVQAVEPVLWEGMPVSSTHVRHLLTEGRVRQVTALLGRYPSLSGQVIRGSQRGRQVGFPTANILIPSKLAIPANGVYACFAWVGDERNPAVTNIGIRPTFIDSERTVETHLLNFDEDLYGVELKIELVAYLRPEMRFDGPAALAAQIRVDIEQAAQLLMPEGVASTS